MVLSGVVTLGDILEILPFQDPIIVLEIDGATLWAALEASLETWPAQEGYVIKLLYEPQLTTVAVASLLFLDSGSRGILVGPVDSVFWAFGLSKKRPAAQLVPLSTAAHLLLQRAQLLTFSMTSIGLCILSLTSKR